jgi:hypothetical protein
LYGLDDPDGSLSPVDVRRVSNIFKKPAFYAGEASRNTIQGALGNCWFLSALATAGTMQGLIDKICVTVSHLDHNREERDAKNSHRETKRLGYMVSSFTWTQGGQMLSLMSKHSVTPSAHWPILFVSAFSTPRYHGMRNSRRRYGLRSKAPCAFLLTSRSKGVCIKTARRHTRILRVKDQKVFIFPHPAMITKLGCKLASKELVTASYA